MTSTWIQSHPASPMARISSPRRAKSAERMEGAILTGLCITKALAQGRQLRNSRKSKSGDPEAFYAGNFLRRHAHKNQRAEETRVGTEGVRKCTYRR